MTGKDASASPEISKGIKDFDFIFLLLVEGVKANRVSRDGDGLQKRPDWQNDPEHHQGP